MTTIRLHTQPDLASQLLATRTASYGSCGAPRRKKTKNKCGSYSKKDMAHVSCSQPKLEAFFRNSSEAMKVKEEAEKAPSPETYVEKMYNWAKTVLYTRQAALVALALAAAYYGYSGDAIKKDLKDVAKSIEEKADSKENFLQSPEVKEALETMKREKGGDQSPGMMKFLLGLVGGVSALVAYVFKKGQMKRHKAAKTIQRYVRNRAEERSNNSRPATPGTRALAEEILKETAQKIDMQRDMQRLEEVKERDRITRKQIQQNKWLQGMDEFQRHTRTEADRGSSIVKSSEHSDNSPRRRSPIRREQTDYAGGRT